MNNHPRFYYMKGVDPRLWKCLRRNLYYISELALHYINFSPHEYPKDGEDVSKAIELMLEQDKESLADFKSIRRKFFNRKGGKYFSPVGCNYDYTYKYCKRKRTVAIFIKKNGVERRLRNRRMLDSKLDIEFADEFLRSIYDFRINIKCERILSGEIKVKNTDKVDEMMRIYDELKEDDRGAE